MLVFVCLNICIFLLHTIIEITRRKTNNLRLNKMGLVVSGTSSSSRVVVAKFIFMCNFESKPLGHH